MLFNSWLFILAFAPLAIGGAGMIRKRLGSSAAIVWLGAASLLFYGASHPEHLPVLLVSIVLNQTVATRMWRSTAARARHWLLLGLAANIGALFGFKYLGFASQLASSALQLDLHLPTPALPVGISFFTFTQIAYLIDLHRRACTPHAGPPYLLFVSYFPHLVAGPVLRHRDTIAQFGSPRFAALQTSDLARGLVLFAIGLAKKVLVADTLAPCADATFAAAENGIALSLWEGWLGLLSYAFQIYFDFSGYSDMALGLSLLLGIDIPVNFRAPYKAASIIDFWRRWHISLSDFLRDYVYIPLGGNRQGRRRRYLNLLLTMLIGGLWHGAAWSFIVWGGLHGAYLLINHLWRDSTAWRLPHAVGAVLTFLAVVLAWSFFRAHTLDGALNVLAAATGLHGLALPQSLGSLALRLGEWLPWLNVSAPGMFWNDLTESKLAWVGAVLAAAFIAWCMPTSVRMAHAEPGDHRPVATPLLLWAGALLAASLMALSRQSPFLYFQF